MNRDHDRLPGILADARGTGRVDPRGFSGSFPDEAMRSALRWTGGRGAQRYPWILAATGHSHDEDLLEAGVRISEQSGGRLHAKSLTVEGER